MIYDIRHLTLYEYGSTVTFSHCALRLLPIGRSRTNRCFRASHRITPEPAQTIERMCFFGNRLTFLTIETAHRKLIVEVNTSIEIDRRRTARRSCNPRLRRGARGKHSRAPRSTRSSPAHFLHPSRLVPRFEPATGYARQSFPAGRPVLARRQGVDAADPGRLQI